MTKTTAASRVAKTHSLRLLATFFLIACSAGLVRVAAQKSAVAPANQAAGAPAGSHPLSGFETVNLFSGNLNFKLPLAEAGGRGGVRVPISLQLNNAGRWNLHRVGMAEDAQNRSGLSYSLRVFEFETLPRTWHAAEGSQGPFGVWTVGNAVEIETRHHGSLLATPSPEPTPNNAPWHIEGGNSSGGYSYNPGGLTGRTDYWGGQWIDNESGPPMKVAGHSLTRLTFSWAGNEYELRDLPTGGEAHPGGTDNQVYSRGRIFVSVDGSSATFVSDAEITEQFEWFHSYGTFFSPSGFLLLSDGTRFRVDEGRISWVRDRNGNVMTFSYEGERRSLDGHPLVTGNRLVGVRDSMGRVTSIFYKGMTDPATGVVLDHDEIRVTGSGGVPRVTKVWRGPLSAPHVGGTTKTLQQLFSAWELDDTTSVYNPANLPYAVELPDGMSYQLRYNEYGDLSRVTLPTGGKIEYDYLMVGTAVGVNRVVGERRVYRNSADAAPELKQVYRYDLSGGIADQKVDVEQRDGADNKLLTFESHYFYGRMADAHWGLYASWREGKEFKTETFNTDGANPTNLLRRVEHTWQARSYPVWYPSATRDTGPAFDPRVIETRTTLENGLVSRRTTVDPQSAAVRIDRFNNPTHSWEYDFRAPGETENLLRHTQTAYVDGANYTGGSWDVGAAMTTTAVQSMLDSPHLRGLPLRTSVYDPGGKERARTTIEYDNYTPDAGGNNRHAALVEYSDIFGLCLTLDAAGSCARTSDTSYTTRGNVTGTTAHLLDKDGDVTGSVTANSRYDIAGNVVKVIDARVKSDGGGYETSFDFSDSFGSPVDDEARSNTAPIELGSKKSYALPRWVMNALGHIAYTQYDYYTGQVVNAEDANGTVSSVHYGDALGRPTKAERAVNVPTLRAQTTFTYDDANRTITMTSDLKQLNDNLLKGEVIYDGLGRTTEERQYETPTQYIRTLTKYDALGSASEVSNPYRPLAQPAESLVWTVTTYDALGRVAATMTPDNAKVHSLYHGTQTLVVDQAGKQRVSKTDALGRLTEVWEVTPNDATKYPGVEAASFPFTLPEGVSQPAAGYRTRYAYDVLGNLREVEQGAQRRHFAYDSLGRLLRARNPEQEANNALALSPAMLNFPGDTNNSWSLGYEYDEAGSLKKRTDARGVETSYDYDALGRISDRSYTNVTLPQGGVVSTPAVKYYYDSQVLPAGAPDFTPGKSTGRLVAVTYGGASSATGSYTGKYDELGRAHYSAQVTVSPDASGQPAAQTYIFSYEYNFNGSLKSETYPSGRVIESEYDAAGRLAGVRKQGGDYYAGGDPAVANNPNVISYTAYGAVAAVRLGNGLWEHTLYNSRLQTYEIGLGTSRTDSSKLKLEYGYGLMIGGAIEATKNNGNVRSQGISVPAAGAMPGQTFTQSYTYDPLNRLETAGEVSGAGQTWEQAYRYDRFGNRNLVESQTKQLNQDGQLVGLINNSNRVVLNPAADAATNRIVEDQNVDGSKEYSYDKAGNLSCDAQHCTTAPAPTPYYRYDGENNMVGVGAGVQYGGAEYVYDGDGHRVKKVVGAVTTVFVYDAAGRLTAEYSDEQRLTQTSYTSYVTQDALGSTRIVTGQGQEVKGRYDYLPFGAEVIEGRAGYGGGSVRQKFTGYERDAETNLDYAQARHYANVQGRFTSVDPLMASGRGDNPQTFNRYSYVVNNPLNVIDPTGMCPDCDDGEPVRSDSNQLSTIWKWRMGQHWYDYINGLLEDDWAPSQIKAYFGVDILAHRPTAASLEAGNEAAARVEPFIQNTPVLGSYFNFLMSGRNANLGGSQGEPYFNGAMIPFDFVGVAGATRRQGAKTVVDVLDTRLADVVKRHSGAVVEGSVDSVRFSSRRAARQAASEMAGDLGSRARPIRASDFRGGPHWMKNSNRVIGRENFGGTRMWRDDFLGHPRFGMGPHVNVSINGRDFHFFY